VKKLLLIFIMMAIWIVASCTTTQVNGIDCWGFWKDGGPKRGTLEKNKFNKHPFRQCVDKNPPHIDLEKRSYE